MSKETHRPQEYKTVRVAYVVIAVIWLASIVATFILTSQYEIQNNNRYNNEVSSKAAVLVEQLKAQK